MSAVHSLLPNSGGVDGIGTTSQPWEEIHANSIKVENNTTKETCFGIRSSGKAGSGSWDDPYDASDVDILDDLIETAVGQSNAIIRFRDGEFTVSSLHYGNRYPRAQAQIYGDGMYSTVLKLSPDIGSSISSSIALINSDANVNGNGIRVENLTLDCNYSNLIDAPTECAVNGIILYGDNSVIRNVRVINGYGNYASSHEHFGILASGHNGGSGMNNIIESCIVEQFLGDYGGGIARAGYSGAICIGGSTSRCLVSGYMPVSLSPTATQVVAYGTTGGRVENCDAITCQKGFYTEAGKDIVISRLNMSAIWEIGIHVNPVTGADIKNILILDNTISMRDDNTLRRWGVVLSEVSGKTREVILSRNIVSLLVTGNTPADTFNGYSLINSSTTGRGVIATSNIFDSALHASVGASDTITRDNVDLTGASLAELPDTMRTPENLNSALGDSLKLTGVYSVNGFTQYFISGSVAVASGDIMKYEVYCDDANAECKPSAYLVFSDASFSSTALDQNGAASQRGDIATRAKGKWYERSISLTSYAAKTTTSVVIEDGSGTAGVSGTRSHYFRNIRIVSSAGTRKLLFCGETPVIPTFSSSSAVAGYSCLPVGAKSLQPVSMADASAPNNYTYYSTDASKLAYKDSGGSVNALY